MRTRARPCALAHQHTHAHLLELTHTKECYRPKHTRARTRTCAGTRTCSQLHQDVQSVQKNTHTHKDAHTHTHTHTHHGNCWNDLGVKAGRTAREKGRLFSCWVIRAIHHPVETSLSNICFSSASSCDLCCQRLSMTCMDHDPTIQHLLCVHAFWKLQDMNQQISIEILDKRR